MNLAGDVNLAGGDSQISAGIFGGNTDQTASVGGAKERRRTSFDGLFAREGAEVRGKLNSGGDKGTLDGSGGDARDVNLDSMDDVSWSEGAGMHVAYVCMYVFVYVCMYDSIDDVSLSEDAGMHVTYVCMCLCMYVCMYVYVCVYARTYTYK